MKLNITVLLGLSLILMSARAILYAVIGSCWPAVFTVSFIALFAASIAFGGRGLVGLARIWGGILCVVGFVRFALAILLSLQPDLSVQGPDMATPSFLTITTGMIVAGFIIMREARQLVSL